MSITESISGLKIAMNKIDIISNNIMNANTNGFKANRDYIQEVVSKIERNNGNENTTGTVISIKKQDFSPGQLIKTGNNLDFYLNKNGFFRLQDIDGSIYYTRNGRFHLDNKNNLTHENGMFLTGYLKNLNEEKYTIEKKKNIINFNKVNKLKFNPTKSINLSGYLNYNDQYKTNRIFNSDDPDTYNYKKDWIVFDEKSNKRTISSYWKKNSILNWTVYLFDETAGNKKISTFDIDYNNYNKMSTFVNKINYFTLPEYHDSKKSQISINVRDLQFTDNKHTKINQPTQDGFDSGELYQYHIQKNGNIIGDYTNQQQRFIGKISINEFCNLDILSQNKDNLWTIKNSGNGSVFVTEDNDTNALTIGAIEKSNVKINEELVNLITAQKNYQAIAQSIKVQDQLIGSLIQNL
ncbi:MAG: flagellar hook-basal body complex protein [Buchnera aphidicola (Eriosoma harunire)]